MTPDYIMTPKYTIIPNYSSWMVSIIHAHLVTNTPDPETSNSFVNISAN